MKNTNVSLSMTLQWQDACATHTCTQYFAKANLWRDILPMAMSDAFSDPAPGMTAQCEVMPGETIEPFDKAQVKTIKLDQFNTSPRPGLTVIPHLGRFYPRSFVRNEPAITADDYRPMRVVAMNNDSMDIDLNSPLASHTLTASARIEQLLPPTQEHGGRCNDFVYDMLQTGVGMQSCLNPASGKQVDFFAGDPFRRLDGRADTEFYNTPRMVHHLDATARQYIEQYYQQQLQPGMQVLDLMSSWVSHLPASMDLQVTGLGMNEEELQNNPALAGYVVHDLNENPGLPFADRSFDRVICTASVEYLVQPIEVFREVARCLKPGGQFIVSFSDRWFPPKAIQLWSELHPYERVALVIAYFKQAQQFSGIETLSIQHYPRPEDDKYADSMIHSDPVFVVRASVAEQAS